MTPSDPDPRTPLWSDKRLDDLIYDTFSVDFTHDDWVFEEALKVVFRLRDDYETECADLRAAATAALGWIDEIYPPDIFDGSSGDEGPVRIAAIRENLRWALRQLKEREP